jgi:hypothetical protein
LHGPRTERRTGDHGHQSRIDTATEAQQGPPATVEAIAEAARSSWAARGVLPPTAGDPSDAALARWRSQADAGRAVIAYD